MFTLKLHLSLALKVKGQIPNLRASSPPRVASEANRASERASERASTMQRAVTRLHSVWAKIPPQNSPIVQLDTYNCACADPVISANQNIANDTSLHKLLVSSRNCTLRKQPSLVASRRWGPFARRVVCASAREIPY